MSATAIGLGVGAATLAGSLINSYQNLKQQADTNDTNYRIWQEQLSAQKENWKQQQANFLQQRRWQLEDTANQRAYDSPASQMARYKAAGINPYLAQQFGSSQSTVGTPQAPSFGSVPNATPMQSQNVDFGFGLAAQNAANAYYMASKNETDMQVAKQHANNETLDTMSKMIQRGFQNEHFKRLADQIAQDIKFNSENWTERSRSIKVANDEIAANQKFVEARTKYQELLNEFTPKEQDKILREFDARYNEIQSAIRKNDAEAAESAARKALFEAQKKGVDISNEVADQLVESRISMGHYEEDQAYWNSRNARKEAGTLKKGVGPYTVEERDRDEAASDPDHMRVQYDRRGRKYMYDNKTNRRIYFD